MDLCSACLSSLRNMISWFHWRLRGTEESLLQKIGTTYTHLQEMYKWQNQEYFQTIIRFIHSTSEPLLLSISVHS